MFKLIFGLLAFMVVAALAWASDRITLQGERTIYTVRCEQGIWQGTRCTGQLVPAERYAFRASRSRHEVVYWIRESGTPSGKYTDCTVADRDNWSCNVGVDQTTSFAHEMLRGKPTRTGVGHVLPSRAVPKWKWWLMHAGVDLFTDASD